MKNFPIIDADGHVTESLDSLRKHLKQENRKRPLFSGEAWDRSFGDTLGKRNEDPRVQLADMDIDGIDIQVIFPTHLSLNSEKEAPLATDIARAYNDWLAEFCATDPRRLKGVAMVALQDVGAAVREIRRAVEQLGHVGVMMPTNVRDQDIGKTEFWPFYEEVERLGIGLALHGGIRAAERMLSIPIHYDDYDVFKSPLSDFHRAVEEAGLEERVHYLSRGETYTFRIAGEGASGSTARNRAGFSGASIRRE